LIKTNIDGYKKEVNIAEINIALDIIMEKTKNPTMIEEERKAFQRKEWGGRLSPHPPSFPGL